MRSDIDESKKINIISNMERRVERLISKDEKNYGGNRGRMGME